MRTPRRQALPLSHVRVLDLTRVLSGPYCTLQLADLGAEVWKIEPVGRGDDARHFGPPFLGTESVYFLSVNRNKRSLAIDLKATEGAALIRRLALAADVVVENFRPSVARRFALDAASLRAERPAIIHCSISGFGHAGLARFSGLAGYDGVTQGLSGLQSLTGSPDAPPVRMGVPIADLITGLTAFQSILIALLDRERTGEGASLDIAMLDAATQLLIYQAVAALNTRVRPARVGNRHPSVSPYDSFETRDGRLNLAVGNDAQFKALCEVLKRPWASEPRFASNPARARNQAVLLERISRIFRLRTTAHWVEVLGRAGVPCGAVLDVREAVRHPQLAARAMIQSARHSQAGALRFLGSALPQATRKHRAPPTLGADTSRVLSSVLRLSARQLAGLRRRRIIG